MSRDHILSRVRSALGRKAANRFRRLRQFGWKRRNGRLKK